jgi:plastocyanin
VAGKRPLAIGAEIGAAIVVAIAGLAVAGAAASSDQANGAPRTVLVTIENVHFDPEVLTIRPGDRVTWVNKDMFPHTATADAKAFDSHSIAPTGAWTFTASKRGTYSYSCAFHPNMKGTIKVQ